MKTRNLLFTVVAIFCLSLSQNAFAEKQDRNVKGFDEIAFSISGELYITIGSEFKVTLEGDEDVLEKIKTEVDGDMLKIKKDRMFKRLKKKVNVYVTLPELEKLVVSGSGKVVTQSPVKAEDFAVVLSGSGTITVDNLIAENLKTVISGSGNIHIKGNGNANYVSSVISGSGDINLAGFNAKKGKVTISGSGDSKVNIENELKAVISGSGSVYYKGNPVINATSVGSGRIRELK